MQGEVPDNEVIDYVRMPRIVKKCPFKVPEVRRATEGTSASTPPSDCSDTVNVVREPARKTPSAEPSPPSPPVEDRRSGAAMINKAAPSNYEASRGHSPVTRHEVERPVGDGARPSVEPTPRPTPAEIHAAASSEAPQTSPMNPVRQRPTPTKQKKMSASNRKKSTSAHARPSQVRAASSGVAQSDRRPSSPSPLAQTQRESVTSRKAPPPTCRRENSSSGTDLDELHNEDFVTDHLESARRKPPVPKQRAKTTAKSTSTALARLEDVEGDAGDGAGKRAYEPDLTVEERMARIRERNEERQNARQLKELRKQGVAKRPQTLVRTKYGPLKAITFSGATGNSRPLAIANEAYEGPEQPAGSSSAEVSPTAAESRRSTRAPDAAASGTHNSDRKAAMRMSGSASSITSEPAGRPRMEEIIEDDIADPRRDAVAARVVHVDPVGVPKLEIDLDDDEDEDG